MADSGNGICTGTGPPTYVAWRAGTTTPMPESMATCPGDELLAGLVGEKLQEKLPQLYWSRALHIHFLAQAKR
jgi:hypothetical protein